MMESQHLMSCDLISVSFFNNNKLQILQPITENFVRMLIAKDQYFSNHNPSNLEAANWCKEKKIQKSKLLGLLFILILNFFIFTFRIQNYQNNSIFSNLTNQEENYCTDPYAQLRDFDDPTKRKSWDKDPSAISPYLQLPGILKLQMKKEPRILRISAQLWKSWVFCFKILIAWRYEDGHL